MKTTHYIKGTLENVEVLAINPCFNWDSLISKVTIKTEDGSAITFPYLGFMNERIAKEIRGSPVVFIEGEEGFIFKDIYQVLIDETGYGFSIIIKKSQANKIMREFSSHFMPPRDYYFPIR